MTPNDIKTGREEAGLTQAELAEALGINVRTIERWESGETIPKTRDTIALEVVFSAEQVGAKASLVPSRKAQKR